MAGCEFHGKYADYLTDQIALNLVEKKGQEFLGLGKVRSVINTIAICKSLREITSGEAENLTSIVFKLYPQFKEVLKAGLINNEGF